LGNEILADDAFGIRVAKEVERRFPGQLEVVCSSASSFHLMDDVLGASRLVVVDTILTGGARPGAVSILTADQMRPVGGSPHFLGLFEVLALGKR
jgi:hydrogenase maturation protease